MELHLIVAHDRNLVIGNDGKLPWHLPEDLKHFKSVTMGSPILMGRGVFEEIGCKPLPGRRNIVLTSRHYNNVEVYASIDEALRKLSDESRVFVIGGGQVYSQMISMCTYMYVTLVHGDFKGDVFFPEYRDDIGTKWRLTRSTPGDKFDLLEYQRITVP
ncbi:MAG: dihydrofolate reductase [Bacteroidetes bacterium]|nr:dihydrofolate reductase [Bacteroidota bacterium]MCH8524407.1 dihydrofolate reductase [Balneolales bacterium]